MRLPTLLEAGLGLVLLIALGVLAWNFDPFGRRQRAENRAAVATEASAQKGEAIRQADTFHTSTVAIRERAREAEDAIRQAPGADAPLDPVRRDVLCAGLSSVWDGATICQPDSPPGVQGTLREPDNPDAD